MKYIIVLGDGMSDEPIKELNNHTPLEYADTQTLDALSGVSEIGLVHTIPEGLKPGSDTANLSVLGYDPRVYYSGRSPLEALSIGVDMEDNDIALRCNLVTLSENGKYEDKTIIDHSSSEISTEEASVLIQSVKEVLETEEFKFYVGTSYRHLLIWKKGLVEEFSQPHDILGKKINEYLPHDQKFKIMMEKSYDILSKHPINKERVAKGLNPANSIWFWGAGTKPKLSSFQEKTGKKGAMISAVDLLKGIAVGAGMTNISVKGANATLHTNYEGKAKAATKALLEDGFDFVYVHVEAPDEMGHQGDVAKKVQAIHYLDNRVIRLIYERMKDSKEDFRMLVLPDHPTPIKYRTHTSDPVPYLLYDSKKPKSNNRRYSEKAAAESGKCFKEGHKIIDYLFDEKNQEDEDVNC